HSDKIIEILRFSGSFERSDLIFCRRTISDILDKVFLHSRQRGRGIDLKALLKSGTHRVMIGHDAGAATRFGNLGVSNDNARASMGFAGSLYGAQLKAENAKLFMMIVMGCLDFAATNDGRSSDTFWLSQKVAGTVLHSQLTRGPSSYQKFAIPVNWNEPKEVLYAKLRQFGTVTRDSRGVVIDFFGNQDNGAIKRIQSISEVGATEIDEIRKLPMCQDFTLTENMRFIPNYKAKDIWKAFDRAIQSGGSVGYDYGSFSMNNDMMLALWEYWTAKKDAAGNSIIKNFFNTGKFDSKKYKRDIDPDFTQPLACLLNAITNNRQKFADILATSYVGASSSDIDKVVANIRSILDDLSKEVNNTINFRKKMGDVDKSTGNVIVKESVTETIEFFLLNKDNPKIFADLTRVVSTISLGADAEWLTYRDALSILNERLLMLADIGDNMREVTPNGEISKPRPATESEKILAEDLRRDRNISNDAFCDFWAHGAHFVLTRADVTGKTPWVGKGNAAGIVIHNSIVLSDKNNPILAG
ncbi:MAG: hypothetical protein HQL28_06050, partial [Candidatus Omnitrophica bacterium]|nr:hypothetical protein [Candidatus Omnitrophota bacterium]